MPNTFLGRGALAEPVGLYLISDSVLSSVCKKINTSVIFYCFLKSGMLWSRSLIETLKNSHGAGTRAGAVPYDAAPQLF
jgi:hypothetical protein